MDAEPAPIDTAAIADGPIDVASTDEPDTELAAAPMVIQAISPPRPGELTATWRAVTALTWILVAVAIASVWRTSDRLGLSTWWIGPRGDQQPRALQLALFAPAMAMILAALNRVRWLAWWGLAASVLQVVVGVFDLGRFRNLALVEVGIGVAAAIASVASWTGTYRRLPDA